MPAPIISILGQMILVGAVCGSGVGYATTAGGGDPIELGRVHWRDDLDAALKEAALTGRPVFIQFQEVPGCATCKRFGHAVLSQPLLVEAIETEFVPVAIHNNRPGRDAGVLQRYGEPSWNNPVVRFVDSTGRDLIARKDGVWAPAGIARRMIEALEAAKRPVPPYLRLAAAEAAAAEPGGAATVTLAVHCFWEGETRLGALEGVITTRAKWHDGREVVEVSFDPRTLSLGRLIAQASESHCADRVYVTDPSQLETAGEQGSVLASPAEDAPASDQKYQLRHSNLDYLPLTPMQATKVNAALGLGENPRRWLSPRQIDLAQQIDAALARNPNALAVLARPASFDSLSSYEAALRAALAASASTVGKPIRQ